MMGVRAALFLLLLTMGVASGAPPSPTGTKRSMEDIQFGNQQNPPVSLLDDAAMPGSFPSSETSEESLGEATSTAKPTVQQEQHLQQTQNTEQPQQANVPQQEEDSRAEEEEEEEDQEQQENEAEPLEPVAQPSRWHVPTPARLRSYRPHWGPLLYGRSTYPVRRRRSVHQRRPAARPDPRVVPQVSLNALRAGQRHKRDLRRYRRDLRPNADLENLLREVELLTMLPRPIHYNPGGYGTVHYAPAPPRYAPQPKLFPDDDEEGDAEDGSALGLLQQNLRGHQLSDAVVVPAGVPGRVWRRSGPYGLSAVPGFKRSSFRANNPPQAAPPQTFTQADLYNLAAMLGAELDPVTHRLRRAAM